MGKDERNDFFTKDNNPGVQGSAFGHVTVAPAGSKNAASQRPVLVPSATPSHGISPIPSATPVVRPTPNAIPSATPGGTGSALSPGGAAIGPITDDPNAMVTPKTQITGATPGGTRSALSRDGAATSVSPIPSPPPGSH